MSKTEGHPVKDMYLADFMLGPKIVKIHCEVTNAMYRIIGTDDWRKKTSKYYMVKPTYQEALDVLYKESNLRLSRAKNAFICARQFADKVYLLGAPKLQS